MSIPLIKMKGRNIMNASLIRDDAYREIFLAVESLNDYVEIDLFDAVFESEEGNEEVANVTQKNEQAKGGAIEHLKKAIAAIRATIANFFKNIASKFEERKMEKEERDAYLAFKEAVKNDPTIKNKTVTVKDYRKVKEDWKKMEEEFRQADEALKRGQDTDVDKLVNKWKESFKSMSGAVGSAVGLEMAVNMAKENRLAATAFSIFFNQCPEVLDQMSNSLDEKTVQKDVKKIRTYTKRCFIRRWFLNITGQLYGSATDAAIGTLKDVGQAIGDPKKFITTRTGRHVASKAMKNDDINAAVKNGADIGKEMAKGYAKGKVDAIKGTTTNAIQRKINENDKQEFASNVNKEKEAVNRLKENFKNKVLKKESVDETLDDMDLILSDIEDETVEEGFNLFKKKDNKVSDEINKLKDDSDVKNTANQMEAYKAKMAEFKNATKPKAVNESNLVDGTSNNTNTNNATTNNIKKEQDDLKKDTDKDLKDVEKAIEKS